MEIKILIAEDDIDIASLYKMVLEARKHNVYLTFNVQNCLKIFEQAHFGDWPVSSEKHAQSKITDANKYDLVILDIDLPNKNGIDVGNEIFKKLPKQRVLFLSSNTNKLNESF